MPRGGSVFFRKDTWHHVHAHGNEELRVLELYAPPPAPARRARTRARKPYLEPADWRYGDDALLGGLPGAEPARRTLHEPAPVWRRSLGVLEGLYVQHRASHRRHCSSSIRARSRGRTRTAATRWSTCSRASSACARSATTGTSVFELNPDDAAYIPQGVAHEYRSYGAPGARALFGVAPCLSAMTHAIGIDVGGTKIAAGMVDTDRAPSRRASSA